MNENKYGDTDTEFGMTTDEIRNEAEERAFYALEALTAAMDRLDILEAAVAWHGWDEIPNEDSEVEIVNKDGDIERVYYRAWSHDGYMENSVGWRYPVGDLG